MRLWRHRLTTKALIVDVDGVLVDGRPEDGSHWQISLESDFSVTPEQLINFSLPSTWDDIIAGCAGLMERLPGCLSTSLRTSARRNYCLSGSE